MKKLKNEFGSVTIDPLGGRVVSWIPAGGAEVIYPPHDSSCVSEEAWSHGGIPICFPWFGRNGPKGSFIHGLVRSRVWSVVSEGPDRITLTVSSDSAMKKWFAGDFRLVLEVTLAKTLSLKLTVENTGRESFTYTNGFHPYFRVADCVEAKVEGLGGLRYWFKTGFGAEPWNGPVTFGVLRDNVFWTSGHKPALVDPVLGRRITVSATGNRRFVVWNPGPEGDIGIPVGDWKRFVCVEPATIPAADGHTIRPGERQTLTMEILLDPVNPKQSGI